ncbi:hypothetical protein L202_05937 [Cryptococcus amylolentus CBS 6039]|uniref:Uncharacterized protein n=1 Tax=Cryptococcus amylolentus CBS 6039 TaxID=1295533 RepID=A0A1E3HHY5_9TREE|nr:hypothetical protein L202_05937 [Cryptococcus amylolentus CBS 6039]ODN75960.1 hypothetical protein L202_05937 [Cryptococcus amylolentus CBS 6039]
MDDASLDGPATLERALRFAARAEDDEQLQHTLMRRAPIQAAPGAWRSEGPVLGQSNAERIRYRCGARHKARSKKCKYYGMAAGEEPEVPRDDTDWRDWEQASGM